VRWVSNEYFRWFDFDLAEAITMSGQLAIRWIERDFNEYLNKLLKTIKVDYVIASDTDSIYVNMKPLVNMLGITDRDKIVEAVHQFCETKIQNMINKSYQNLADYMCAYQQKMFMKRETIANKAIGVKSFRGSYGSLGIKNGLMEMIELNKKQISQNLA
jgi:DNA polymerase elongation subunit (family B)